MMQAEAGSTDPLLLKRVAALWDNPAWGEFFHRYDPVLRGWFISYGFDPASIDELCQRVWVELARRMPSYQYDPGGCPAAGSGVFAGTAIDLFRERSSRLLEDNGQIDDRWTERRSDDEEISSQRMLLLQEAREVQEEVRSKVKPVRWEVFWRVMIEGSRIQSVASDLGLKYATAYAGANHVAELLRRRRATSQGKTRPDRFLVSDGGLDEDDDELPESARTDRAGARHV